MSKNSPLHNDTQNTEPAGQTSNKSGKHSAAVKPSSAGPDSHGKHKAEVAGAFGSRQEEAENSNDTPLGQWVPADKANLKK